MTSVDPQRPKRVKEPAKPPPIAPPTTASYSAWSAPLDAATPPPPAPPVLPPAPSPPLPMPVLPAVQAGEPAAAVPLTQPRRAATAQTATGPAFPASQPVAQSPFVPQQPGGRDSTRKPQVPAGAVLTRPFSIAPVPQATLPAPVLAAQSTDENLPHTTEQAVKGAPPFLVSMVVHMVLVIVLALLTVHQAIKNQIQLEAVYAETLGKQLIDDKLQTPDSLEMQVEVPTLSFDLNPVNDPLAAPPKMPDFFLDANKATSSVEAPSIGSALTGREAGMKKALLAAYGGTATTEGAVLAGLEWLKKQQMKDGGWSLVGPYPDGSNTGENRCAATAMALLAFQGYGATHLPGGTTPDFHDVVERGWSYLLKTQDKDGVFVHDGGHNQRMYAQAQATIALCEIFGMTKDVKFRKPAQLALDFVHKAQSPEFGGWRYEPRIDSDLSVTGWYVMALQSGLMAGLEVQSPNLDSISKFLDRVGVENGTQYCYQIGGKPTLTMTAEALLCRQYLGWQHDDPRMRAGVDQLLANRIDYDEDQNVYYWYYATQACHHMDGPDWNRWNEVMRQAIPAAQVKTGSDRGSWNSLSDRWGSHGGRLYVSCLSIFMLETYYRHLPIYKWRLQ